MEICWWINQQSVRIKYIWESFKQDDECLSDIAMHRSVCCLRELTGALFVRTSDETHVRDVTCLLTLHTRQAHDVLPARCVYDDEGKKKKKEISTGAVAIRTITKSYRFVKTHLEIPKVTGVMQEEPSNFGEFSTPRLSALRTRPSTLKSKPELT